MPAADLALLVDAARAAGEVALGFTGATARSWDKPGDAGPVTEADLAVNDRLAGILKPARPDYGWLSEESPDSPDRLAMDRVFIIDPIDGTRSFIDGSSTWAHAIAVAEAGVVTAAVIYLPMRDELFAAAAGQGATLNGAPIAPSDTAGMKDATVLAARPALESRHWKAGPPPFKREYRPSLAYRMATVAEGRFDGMLTLRRTWEWDVAAGDLILREAGARVSDRLGQALRFNNPQPSVNGVLAGGAAVHAGLLAALTQS
ncbi:inositol monophosphatase family protein [Marinibacterium profundimaris]|uniref:Inositol monophosphatase n=1 Tax=Marinibacterium profundimaris TaxID=1679460 RepID=A0A225NIE4_9RHOB|nr:3'(2'),5'-bisphosphate nucleotidase CysQ [Marinibacterium profundimaris]OWU73605.1 inositol monophosphatase [Marinibacterium profundimaris]